MIRGIWEGQFFVHHSLAYVNRELGLALLDSGRVELSLTAYEQPAFDETDDPRLRRLKERFAAPLTGSVDFHLRHEYPPQFQPPAEGHWIMIQPWEFVGLPRPWLAPMRDVVDEIWVPTRFVKDGYVQSGLDPDKVHVVPNGVDTRLFTPEGPKADLATTKSFKFLYVGGTIYRKGIDVLVDAYLRAFTAEDDVCLVIKDFCVNSLYSQSNLAHLIREAQARPNAPEILYMTDDLSGPDLAALYRACDALAHPYRGEGFGLPIAEAMACGVPPIVPNYGACLDFCDAESAVLVPSELVRLPDALDALPTTIGYYVSEVRRDALAEALRSAAAHPGRMRQLGERASERIHRDVTWHRAAEVALARLRALKAKPILRHAPDFADPALYHPGIEPIAIEGRRAFNFLAFPDWNGGDWQPLLRSYLAAFSAGNDVALVMRCDAGETVLAEARLIEALELLGRDPEDIPDILLVDTPLSPDRLGGVFTACQVLLSAPGGPEVKRARACGLAVLEAPTPEQLRQILVDLPLPIIQ